MDNPQLVGVASMADVGSVGRLGAPAAVDVEVTAKVKVDERSGVKRKRGRPPGRQAKPRASRNRDEEEDVCFICFDGGSLVLCDRRGCPKAYHPACIKRDEAFFRSRAKWNCGWHICSSCQKAAHVMCYTCTYSLCKACTKDADYLCLRENKGFCTTCLKTIMLLESCEQGTKETAQVDFDDQSSWEYLFKVYWVRLKGKLSLTLDELTKAQNFWKAVGNVACEGPSLNVHCCYNDGKRSISNHPFGHVEADNSKRSKEQPILPNRMSHLSMDKSTSYSSISKEWASEELLEFVAHMRNGDTSVLSLLDVQSLVLDYIKRNNLCDPQQCSEIICDMRLKNLFGKSLVGHIEIVSLLESHFVKKEDSQKDVIQGNNVDPNSPMMAKDKKRKAWRKGEESGPQKNLNKYAAIDTHNINLVYLRRDLMESLIEDNEKFHDKVVGSIVRIRISGSDQNQDIYRLVQVIGTCKAAIPYKVGEKTSEILLEILNLDKKEIISINAVSNEEFSEDECWQLHQNVKCGIVQWLTVGWVQEKALAILEVKCNDWLKRETTRLNNLLDQASDKGHKKELREYVEKLELLKATEQLKDKLQEILQVHADRSMDPNCESDEDAGVTSSKKQDEDEKPRCFEISRNVREVIYPQDGDIWNSSGSTLWKKLSTSDQNRTISSPFYLGKEAFSWVLEGGNGSLWNNGKSACGSNALEKPDQVDSSGSVVEGENNKSGQAGSETSAASLSIGSAPSVNFCETDSVWHHRDPQGKIRGPFSLVQLHKWSTSGNFPTDMRIWSVNDEECDSLLLTDVLSEHFHKVSALLNNSLPSPEVQHVSDNRFNHYDDGKCCDSINSCEIDRKQNEGPLNSRDPVAHSNGPVDSAKEGSNSANCVMPDVDNNSVRSPSKCEEVVKVQNSYSDTKIHKDQRCTSPPDDGKLSSHGNVICQSTTGQRQDESNLQDYASQSSGENGIPILVNNFSNNWDSKSGFVSVCKSTDSSGQDSGTDVSNLPTPTLLNNSKGDLEGQITKDKHQLVPLNAPFCNAGVEDLPVVTRKPSDEDEKGDSSFQNMSSPLPEPSNEDKKVQAIENKHFVSTFPVQDSGSSRGSASGPVEGGRSQFPKIADQCDGHSQPCTKPSVNESNSSLMSPSSLKPPDVDGHQAVMSSCNGLTPSPADPTSNASCWKDIDNEPIELSTLVEESVSDLLAEVDAMESQCGLATPTSVMNSDDELFQDSKTNCFTTLGGLSPPVDSGKIDAPNSMRDAFSSQPNKTDEPLRTSQATAVDPAKSSTSTDMEVEIKPTDCQVNPSGAGSNSQVHAASTMNREVTGADTAPGAGAKSIDIGCGTLQGDTNLGKGKSTPGITDTSGTGHRTAKENTSMNRSSLGGCTWRDNYPKHRTDKFVGPRDGAFQSGDPGSARRRSSWSRQSSIFHSGGSYSRPPKGQRPCKFYRNGHCKKGASCDFLHL